MCLLVSWPLSAGLPLLGGSGGGPGGQEGWESIEGQAPLEAGPVGCWVADHKPIVMQRQGLEGPGSPSLIVHENWGEKLDFKGQRAPGPAQLEGALHFPRGSVKFAVRVPLWD